MATNSREEQLLDDDPTNELPVLDPDTAVGRVGPLPENAPDLGRNPLLNLDSSEDQQVMALEAQLAESEGELDTLRREVQRGRKRLAAGEAKLKQRADTIDMLTGELRDAGDRAQQQEAELQRLTDDIRALQATSAANKADGAAAATIADLREQISTLDHYIANRGEHWRGLEAALEAEQTRVAELLAELAQREQQASEAEQRERQAVKNPGPADR